MSTSRTWREALEDINTAQVQEEEVEEENLDNPEGSVDEESPVEDSPAEAPEEAETTESESDEGDEPTDAQEEPEEAEAEDQPEAEADEEKEPTVLINGEEVPLSTVMEWRDSGLRAQDYTRKTMTLAEQRKQFEQERQATAKLATDISNDPALQRFLAAHPEALQYLMSDPAATRNLIGNEGRVKQFWSEYDIIRENPSIAERLYNRENPDVKPPEMVEAEMQQAATNVGHALNHVIETIGQEYPDVDQTEVANYLMELGGLTEANLPRDPQLQKKAVYGAMARLQQMLFYENNGQVFVDPRLVKDRFEAMARVQEKKKTTEQTKADQHNAKVDKALAESGRPPATPSGGTPRSEREKPKPYSSFQDALADIAI